MDSVHRPTPGTPAIPCQSGRERPAAYPLTNPIRHYAWGSAEYIPQLLGLPYTGEPHAEIWMGAHPADPSWVTDQLSLAQRVALDPQSVLGARVRDQFGDRLPFLLKILTASQPLSLQVHPNDEQAARGFAAEDVAGVDLYAPARRYHDPYGKPEMIVALTDFAALSGIRPVEATMAFLATLRVDHPRWQGLTEVLAGYDGVRAYLTSVLSGASWSAELVAAVAQACQGLTSPEAVTIADLARRYPGDAGVLVAMLLNRISLGPGEAIYVGPGDLHAYLHGAGVEIMGSSDNVLRAGLTSKLIDPDEVLSLTDVTPRPPRFVPTVQQGASTRYDCVAQEFRLDQVCLGASVPTFTFSCDGPVVVLGVEGHTQVQTGAQPAVPVAQGGAVLVEARAGGVVTLAGQGKVFVARA